MRRAVGGTEGKGMGLERRGEGLLRPEEEEEEALLERKAAECRASWARASGLVVSERGWACSEWVAAGAAGEARAAEGVAGESSMLPWEEAGLSQGFSTGRYCTQGFLLLETREPGRGSKGTHQHPHAVQSWVARTAGAKPSIHAWEWGCPHIAAAPEHGQPPGMSY